MVQVKETSEAKLFSASFFSSLFAFRNFSFQRVLVGFLSPCFLGFSLGLAVPLQLGSLSIAVLYEGLYTNYGIPLGVSNLVLILCLYLSAWGIGRIPLGLGTLPTVFLISPAIELGNAIVPEGLSFLIRLVLLLISLGIMGLSIALSAGANLGPEAVAAFSLAIEKRFRWSVEVVMFAVAFVSVCIGWVLGGDVQLGTVASLVIPAICVNVLLEPIRRWLK